MRITDPGHRYELLVLDDEHKMLLCPLVFVKREGLNYPGNVGHHPGTTTQEVLRACIARAWYVNEQIPCWQTRLSIFLMSLVVWLYEQRASKRHGWRVPGISEAVLSKPCSHCGHVCCEQLETKVL
jgi:hypothetical protein